MNRYFEFVGGTSAKFWEVSVSGCDVTARYGRLGTSGQIQTKTLDDAAAAQKHAEKLIGQKLEKGYVEKQLA
jgi:predicted DNA-binding WGR domain protein